MPPRLEHRPVAKGQHNILDRHAADTASQCGEDGILQRIFELAPPHHTACAELGAWDGKLYSNTWNLIHNHGWNGVLIEADPDRFADLQRTYAAAEGVTLRNVCAGFEPGETLDDIFTEAGLPEDFDLLSLDVDGADYHLWQSLERFSPLVAVVEFNPTIPNDVLFVQERDLAVKQGCSLAALTELGSQKGYELIATTGWNAFFIRREHFHIFGIKDNSLDAMYDDNRFATKLFQLYDGSLALAGNKRLLWKGWDFAEEDIQVVPVSQRFYSDEGA